MSSLAITSGMRSWIDANAAFAAIVTIAKVRSYAQVPGFFQFSQLPAMAIGSPSARRMAWRFRLRSFCSKLSAGKGQRRLR